MTYEYITHEGNKIQVDSAIRDGSGNMITNTYLRRTQDITVIVSGDGTVPLYIRATHNLNVIPSSVEVYTRGNTQDPWESIITDVQADAQKVTVTFPAGCVPPAGTQILIKLAL